MNRIKAVNLVFFATVLVSIAGSYITANILKVTNNYLIILLVSQIILVIPTLVYLAIYKVNVAKAIRFHKIKPSNIILIIIFSYLISPLMNLINAISMMFVKNEMADVMNNVMSNNGFWLSLFMIAFVPCILEESVYRGIFFNEYRKISPLKGIFLSGFLFGIMHGNLNQFSYAFIMGIVFAFLIEATDSILATMIVHFFINGTSVVIMALYPKLLKMLEVLYGSEQFNADELISSMNTQPLNSADFISIIQIYGPAALISGILAFIVYRTIAKNSGRWEHMKGLFSKKTNTANSNDFPYHTSVNSSQYGEQASYLDDVTEDTGSKRLFTVSLILGILICVGLMVYNEIFSHRVVEQPTGEYYTMICNLFQYLR